jgi:hypothetical protein
MVTDRQDTHMASGPKTLFSLVVDDFGVKYVGREHAEHLMACIRKTIIFPATGMEVPTVA